MQKNSRFRRVNLFSKAVPPLANSGDTQNEEKNYELLIAEFEALRTEILQRQNMQWSIFALQLTAGAVVFSFSLSNSSHIDFLLILPLLTWALSGRYVSQHIAIQRLGRYIREVLEPKTGGRLAWESWSKSQHSAVWTLTWLNPLYLSFTGVAAASLVWVAPSVWTSHGFSFLGHVMLIIAWFIGIVMTILSLQMLIQMLSRHWRRDPSAKANIF
jgi:hypothetical protein